MIFITQENELILDKGRCVLYFYASWMPYNKKMLIMQQKYKKTIFYAINAEDFRPFCKRFSIDSVPTVLIFDKKELKRIKGLVLTSAFKSAFVDIYSKKEK